LLPVPHSDELDQTPSFLDVQLVPPPGELLLNITSCLILVHWPNGM